MTYNEALMGAYKAPILKYLGFGKEQLGCVAQSANAFFMLVLDEKKNGIHEPYHT